MRLYACDADDCESDDMDEKSVNKVTVRLQGAQEKEVHFCDDHAEEAVLSNDLMKKAIFSDDD